MNIDQVWAVSFSPTGTSRKIVEAIAAEISGGKYNSVDLTPFAEIKEKRFTAKDFVVIGVPVYAGRVAPLAVKRLKALQGEKTPAVLVVLYGNREYEDALIELRDIAEEASFLPAAASAFIGEHSFSDSDMPIAAGRPDGADLKLAASLGKKVIRKIDKLESLDSLSSLNVPGNFPYKDGMGSIPITPKVDLTECSRCGLCVPNCPGGAIAINDDLVMDVDRCIFCCACIKICQEKAVYIDAPPMKEKQQWLHENYSKRKEPELYF